MREGGGQIQSVGLQSFLKTRSVRLRGEYDAGSTCAETRTYREESLLLIALLKTRLPTLLPGYTRVARELARPGPGLWLAAGRRGPAVRAEPFSIVQTLASGRSASL